MNKFKLIALTAMIAGFAIASTSNAQTPPVPQPNPIPSPAPTPGPNPTPTMDQFGMVVVAPNCSSSSNNAWQTYGAKAFFSANESIFANVTSEISENGSANIGGSLMQVGTGNPRTTSDAINTFKGKLAAFLVYSYGGPDKIKYTDGITYDGRQDMTAAHKGLAITSEQYDYFLANIVVPALIKNGVTQADVATCFAPILTDANFKASIVGQ